MNAYLDEAKALKRERRKERKKPPSCVLKEGTPARYRVDLARCVYNHRNLDNVLALQQEIERVDDLYNKPIEAVISNGDLYLRCVG